MGKLDEAVVSYHKALAIKPDYAEAHSNLGVALQDQGKLDEAVASFHKALAINPDYAEAHHNLGVALQGQGRIDEAIGYLKRADPETVKSKSSAHLLKCYYIKQDKGEFDRQLDLISKNQKFNFQAASISAFVSHQLGTRNAYKFCDDPVNLVTVYDLLDSGDVSPDLITDMKIALENNLVNEQIDPGHISKGFKSYGNLFLEKFPFIEILEQGIRHCIGRFFQQHHHNQSRLFWDWPIRYVLNGWYVRLLKGGEISAHCHEGWLSGVFYVQVPAEKNNDAGNIEFTLHGDGLPVIREDFPSRIITTQPGRLVLFPSSIPHRVLPFTTNQERISISFDVIPS